MVNNKQPLRRTALLAAVALTLLVSVSSQPDPASANKGRSNKDRHCVGVPSSAERPVQAVKLASGETFCLRLPRYLKNPASDVAGISTFPRTWDDTCGLYGITYHAKLPKGAGPDPHMHLSDEEYFMPTTPGEVLRVFTEAGPKEPRRYQPGEMPGYNLPPVSPMGHLDVPGGTIAYSPPNIPHTWKGATDLTAFVIFWVNGFVMEPSIDIPQSSKNATEVLFETSLWASPTDITAGIFGGPDFTERALQRKINLPAVTYERMQRLQARFDEGEACYPADGKRRASSRLKPSLRG